MRETKGPVSTCRFTPHLLGSAKWLEIGRARAISRIQGKESVFTRLFDLLFASQHSMSNLFRDKNL
jgi:hypothetical protein